MKRIASTLLIICLMICGINAQMTVNETPYSFKNPINVKDADIPTKLISQPNLAKLQTEDEADAKAGNPTRFAVLKKANITLDNAGTWTTLRNGDRIWKMKIAAPQAKALSLTYRNFYIPAGAKLFLYNEAKTDVLGALTSINNKANGYFATGNIQGETTIMEYYEPAAVQGEGIIDIDKIGYVYRYEDTSIEKASDPCEVDVNCTEGNNWQDEKRGVVRIAIVAGGNQYWCTGSLINNTAQDCKPYILTALHCGLDSSPADFGQYVFYFNYETANCGSGNAPTNQSVTGCTKRADSGDDGGNNGSDYLLVEATTAIPAAYNVHYNGWNAQTAASQSGVSIHHPAGDRKKISTYTSTLSTASWQNAPGSHWQVNWVATSNGHGVTEGGSSGSPIFDSNGRIVGQLTGGSSYCTSPNNPDLYGKMSYNWTSNPGDDLKPLLDPINSGALVLDGADEPCNGGNPTPTCTDGVQNGQETGIDCGGPDCSPCQTAPTCTDGVQNGQETGIDCGGPDCSPCQTAPTCTDGVQNGQETGIDCGGPDCSPCQTAPTCTDGIQNGQETGVDCGGPDCTPCQTDPTGCTVDAIDPSTGDALTNAACIEAVQAADDYCCSVGWDGVCQTAYEECVGDTGGNGCTVEAINPTTGEALSDIACVEEVQVADDYCCNVGWDGICQAAYDECAGTDEPETCEAPQDFTVTKVKTFKATVNWEVIPDAVKYRIRYREAGYNDAWVAKNSNINKKTIKNLYAGTEYEYQVRTKCPNGWTGWSNINYFITASYTALAIDSDTDEQAKASVTAYPNPSTGIINLKTVKLDGVATIKVLSTVGQEVKVIQSDLNAGDVLRLDLTTIQDGIYFIIVETADERITQRVILARR